MKDRSAPRELDRRLRDELQERLRDIDTSIAELRGVAPAGGREVRDPEEIANDLVSQEEQEAVLAMLEQRRDSIRARLERLPT